MCSSGMNSSNVLIHAYQNENQITKKSRHYIKQIQHLGVNRNQIQRKA